MDKEKKERYEDKREGASKDGREAYGKEVKEGRIIGIGMLTEDIPRRKREDCKEDCLCLRQNASKMRNKRIKGRRQHFHPHD